MAEPDVVVTNAHVVAGETGHDRGGRRGIAEPAGASRSRSTRSDDIAVLRVPELEPADAELRGQHPRPVPPGAILGYPENGPFDVQPGRIGTHADGDHPERLRPGTGLAAADTAARARAPRQLRAVRSWTSTGSVLTTVFAATVDSSVRGGYGVANETVAAVLREADAHERAGSQVSTGPCTSG